jgi:hypothetical protein
MSIGTGQLTFSFCLYFMSGSSSNVRLATNKRGPGSYIRREQEEHILKEILVYTG